MQAIKVWHPESAPESPLTMREAFGRYLRPSLSGRRANATLRQYETAIRHWERFCTEGGETESESASTMSTRATLPGGGHAIDRGIDDCGRITDVMLDAWAMHLHNGGLSADTINKTWRYLRAILRRIGPRESRNPKAIGLIDRVPAMEPITELDNDSDGQAVILSKSQLEALYNACDVATWPATAPALAWRVFLVLSACLGARVEDAAGFDWSHISLEPESPARSSSAVWQPGFLCWIPEKTKRKKSSRLILPLPTCCRMHLDQLRRAVPSDPNERNTIYGWTVGAVDRRREQWNLIAAQAGCPNAQRKHLRPTCNVLWNRASKSGLGRWVLGHSARDINDAAYMRAEPELIAFADQLDLPECFLRGRTGETQPFLF